MTKENVGYFTVRVWRHFEECPINLNDKEVKEVLEKLKEQATFSIIEVRHIREELEKIPKIAAYEILNEKGCGIVVYTTW